jgi:hypothetical protein
MTKLALRSVNFTVLQTLISDLFQQTAGETIIGSRALRSKSLGASAPT